MQPNFSDLIESVHINVLSHFGRVSGGRARQRIVAAALVATSKQTRAAKRLIMTCSSYMNKLLLIHCAFK